MIGSCRLSRWHGDSSSTHGPLMWCIGCPCSGVGRRGGLFEKRPELLSRRLTPNRGQPTTCGQRAVDPLPRGTGCCSQSPVHPAPRTASAVGSSFSAVFPSTDCTRTTLPHQGLQHMAWAFHHRDIPMHYRNRVCAPTGPICLTHVIIVVREGKRKKLSPQKNAFPFALEHVISNTANSLVWSFSKVFSFTVSVKS